jgi:hypothetical protein
MSGCPAGIGAGIGERTLWGTLAPNGKTVIPAMKIADRAEYRREGDFGAAG